MGQFRKYYRNPDFIFRHVAGEAVLIPLMKDVADLEAIFSLNEVGVFIWEQMEHPITIGNLKKLLVSEFEVEAEVLKNDLTHFIEELLGAGIILEAK